ncbi:hypothetical protein [Polycladidibacter hongkongensis]|uniref:hypothetical protein n=1 Tax=Polycladidibacter hongkongensis TaxID=1647556 RepID=UPI000AE71404|nr:hypothetical protein [Pseudovibrio hongkongensis]
MRLSAPSLLAFFIALLLGALSIASVGFGVHIPVISTYAYWALASAWGLLTISALFKGI